MSSDKSIPLTIRYGIHTEWQEGSEHYGFRHAALHFSDMYLFCELDNDYRCRCSGIPCREGLKVQCCRRMTGDDLRCDECREWCHVISGDRLQPVPLIPDSPAEPKAGHANELA